VLRIPAFTTTFTLAVLGKGELGLPIHTMSRYAWPRKDFMPLRLKLILPHGTARSGASRRLGLSDANVAVIPEWVLPASDAGRLWVARPLPVADLVRAHTELQGRIQDLPSLSDGGEIASDSRCLWERDPEDQAPPLWIDLTPMLVVLGAQLALIGEHGDLRLESP
jgi:hypothetical protein